MLLRRDRPASHAHVERLAVPVDDVKDEGDLAPGRVELPLVVLELGPLPDRVPGVEDVVAGCASSPLGISGPGRVVTSTRRELGGGTFIRLLTGGVIAWPAGPTVQVISS